MFIISQAAESDIPAIIEIAEKTWWQTYSSLLTSEQIRYMLNALYAPETIQKDMRAGTQTYLLIQDDHLPQGFASFGRRKDEQGVFKIHKLYVLPDKQGKGYGKALIQEIKNRLLRENIHKLDLNVNRFNPARHFYEKIGFGLLREEDIPIGPYWMNDFVMRTEF